MSECGRPLGIHITIHQVTVAHERTKEGIVKMFQVHLTAPIRGSYMAQCYSRWPDAALTSTAMIFSLPEINPDSPETSYQAQQCESGNDEQMSGLPKNQAQKTVSGNIPTFVDMRALRNQGDWRLNFKDAPSFRTSLKDLLSGAIHITKPLETEVCVTP